MTIVDMLRASPNIKVEITAKDLVDFADDLVLRFRNEVDNIPEDGFYTVDEVMEIYRIKARSTLYKWDKRGYLPCEKKGSRVMYQKSLVHKVLGNPKMLKTR